MNAHAIRRLVVGLVLSVSATASIQAQDAIEIARGGTRAPRVAPRENFTGVVRVLPLFDTTATSRASGASVSFEAGARSAWHTHPRGQVLVVTAGLGRVQAWGNNVEEIREGDVVRIPADVKHWHGAAPTAAMTHVAVQEHLDGNFVEWMENVSAAQYAVSPSSAAAAGEQPSRAQQIMGDFAPKLAELTDSVLFADVWERPGLSKRDRSLATISALIAMDRPDQLRSHIQRARDNGLTQQEMVETITHLAFYAGWPSAVTAVTIAKEIFQR